MNEWFPSRKIRIFFGVMAILIVGVFFVTKGRSILFESKSGSLVVSNKLIKSISEKDSDKDGLKDWEENLWGTDPFNSDTDGNGVLDGDESLEKNKNQFLTEESSSPKTDMFSRVFLSKYIQLKKDGNEINENSVSNLLSEVVNQSLESNTLYEGIKYNKTNLEIVESTEKNIETYKRNFLNLLEKKASFLSGKKYDLIIVEDFLKNKNPSVLAELEYAGVIYKGIRDDLLEMRVPESVYYNHLNLLNSIHDIYMVVDGLSRENIFADPIVVLANVKKYVQHEEDILKEVSYLINYSN